MYIYIFMYILVYMYVCQLWNNKAVIDNSQNKFIQFIAVRFNCLWAVFFSSYQQNNYVQIGGHLNKRSIPKIQLQFFVLLCFTFYQRFPRTSWENGNQGFSLFNIGFQQSSISKPTCLFTLFSPKFFISIPSIIISFQ